MIPTTRANPASGSQKLSSLSPARQRLIRLCQWINYGEIQRPQIRRSEPVFEDSTPLIVREVKLNADQGARAEFDLPDFILCNEVRQLLAHLDEIEDGIIARVEVRAGIARRIILESAALGKLK